MRNVDVNFRMRNLPHDQGFRMGNSLSGMILLMKNKSMRKLLAENVRRWMARVPAVDTQAKLAAHAGMSQSSVHRVLHEDTEPELETAYKLACAIGISVSDLLREDDGTTVAPFDLERYAALPDMEKEKIRAFAEFVLTSHESARSHQPSSEQFTETIRPDPEQSRLVKHVAQRNLTTDTLTTHVQPSQNRKNTRKTKGH
ncbi:DNA-binding XRE family transcriptional regulator [Paraburkholderia sp. EB58]|uniref:helix-turn-helix domain-containing protein n=1 Tax=Paraburkholderia sp. EB58 TaxID=3035125 RepID=UPI003D1F65C8